MYVCMWHKVCLQKLCYVDLLCNMQVGTAMYYALAIWTSHALQRSCPFLEIRGPMIWGISLLYITQQAAKGIAVASENDCL